MTTVTAADRNTSEGRMRGLPPALFLIALCTLTVQLMLVRVFDVILNPSMGYMIISSALFAFGLAGIYASLRTPPADAMLSRTLARITALFGVSILLIRPSLNALPFDYELLTDQPIAQTASFLEMYAVLSLPFFLAGLFFAIVFGRFSSRIQSLYSWDLAGAAAGCVIFLPFLPVMGPGGLLLCAAALSFVASALLSENGTFRTIAVFAAVLFVAIPILHAPDYYDFRIHLSKRGIKEAEAAGRVEFTRWDPISKIDVVDIARRDQLTGAPLPSIKHVAYDGGAQSSHIFPFDGDLAALRADLANSWVDHFWELGVLASHHHLEGTNPDVLIIGAAGGQEVKAALVYGARRIEAVEMVGAVVELGRARYAELGGNIYNHPAVRYSVGEGRSYLRSHADRFDIIQIFSNHTSSSIAAGSGALGPNYLQTAEAYREYFEHLTETGVLHINHHLYPRMISTAAAGWRLLGRNDFQKHVLVYDRTTPHTLPTLLIKMRPWTSADVEHLNELFATAGGEYRLMEDPLNPSLSQLHPQFFAGAFSPEMSQRIPYFAGASTDDKPFFNHFRKPLPLRPLAADPDRYLDATTAEFIDWMFRFGKRVPMDILHLAITGIVSAIFIGLFVVIPLRFSALRSVSWPTKRSTLAYFSCLGAGFIIIELILIQLFMKLVGYPLYTFACVMFSLLVAAGLGSQVSGRLRIHEGSRWGIPFIGIIGYGIGLVLLQPVVFQMLLAAPTPARIIAAAVLILPLGFFLGMPFPLGVLTLRTLPSGAVAWAWAMNGLFTLVGGLLSVILSLSIGFRMTLLFALAAYALAFILLSRMRAVVSTHASTSPESSLAAHDPSTVAAGAI